MLDMSCLHRRASRVLPEALHTCALMDAPRDEAGLARWMLPLRHVPHGSLRFRLEEATAQALLRDPWPCLAQAHHARRGLGPRAARLSYADWERLATGTEPIYRSRSQDGRAVIWLLPSQRLLIYRWNDHPHATRERNMAWNC